MIADAVAAERFMRAAMLGVAMAVEAQRILRVHMGEGSVYAGSGAEVAVDIPFPDSTVMAAVLDAAATCFPEAVGPPESARQAVLRPLLDLAALAQDS